MFLSGGTMKNQLKFTSKRERYDFMCKTSPKMVSVITEVQEAFGTVLLSNVGTGEHVYSEVENIWEKLK